MGANHRRRLIDHHDRWGGLPGRAHSADHTVIPDRIEAATYLCAVGITGGEITVAGARHEHMSMLCQKLGEMGMRISHDPDGLGAAPRRMTSADCQSLPYPGIATDFKPFLVTLLATADGVGIVTENLFSGRFRYVDELRRMGADIRTDSHHAVIRGSRSSGAPVRAHDIRAGSAFVIAGLAADGETTWPTPTMSPAATTTSPASSAASAATSSPDNSSAGTLSSHLRW